MVGSRRDHADDFSGAGLLTCDALATRSSAIAVFAWSRRRTTAARGARANIDGTFEFGASSFPISRRRRLARMVSGILRKRLPIGYGVLGAILVFLIHDDFGPTWDDSFHAKVGALAVKYFATWGSDRSIDDFDDARFYGPLLEMIPALLRGSTAGLDAELFESRHLWNGAIALLAIPALLALGRGFGIRGAASLALLALVAQPRFTGDALINSKDSPFLVMVTWFHLALTRVAIARTPGSREWILLGVSWGAALWVRPGALPMLLVESLVVFAARDLLRGAERRGSPRFLPGFLLAFVIAWTLMVIPWPSAHREPLLHPLRTMGAAVRFYTEYPVLWEGEYRSSVDLPRTYLPKMLLYTTPLVVLLASGIGACLIVARVRRRPRSRVALRGVIAIAWAAIPVSAAIVTRPNVYDGIRHFLFVLPAFALLAGYAGARAIRMFGRRARVAAAICVASLFLWPVVDLCRLHPYSYTYFNELTGGVAGASRRFETDYFLTAYREAIETISERAAREPERRFVALVGGAESMMDGARALAAENLELRLARPDRRWPDRLPDDVDFYLGATRFRMASEPFSAEPIVVRVEREGAVFAVVRARDGIW